VCQRFHRPEPAPIPDELLRLIEAAEVEPGGPPCLGAAETAPDVLVFEQTEMGLELFAELAVDAAETKQFPEARAENSPAHHITCLRA
jgi:hypothetical protein